ncbi:hypothetical protein [Cupriavidus pampae]|uniref:Uncharacterized protein n=1 Tax=Cupriavidus pampae TaxID=659251 RepID=A0ABN7ZCN9_9BURK|nr:hypothetical protein [Cupriavidus pampae]CAG9183729.1 hypothetical protein LMG32289_05403 [Cupriavidus pampae]
MSSVEAFRAPVALQEVRGAPAGGRADAAYAPAGLAVLALRDAVRAWTPTGGTPARPGDLPERATLDATVDAAFDAVIADVYTTFSLRYLRTLRQFLAPHATNRHTITVYADWQDCGLCVDGVRVEAKPARGVYRLLQAISASLTHKWCVALDGERLN